MTLDHAWESHKGLVYTLASRHAKQGNHDYDEVLGQASYLFCLAVNTWDGLSSSLAHWIACSVRYGLLDWDRQERPWEERVDQDRPWCAQFGFSIPVKENPFPGWLDSLRDDARFVISTILDTPEEVLPTHGLGKKKHIKITLRNMLRKSGWKHVRIREAFREIREAL